MLMCRNRMGLHTTRCDSARNYFIRCSFNSPCTERLHHSRAERGDLLAALHGVGAPVRCLQLISPPATDRLAMQLNSPDGGTMELKLFSERGR